MINIVDLFSGVGGLTFGFCYKIRGNRFVRNRTNNILFANEYDPQAALAFKTNFPKIPLIQDDIANVTVKRLNADNINFDDVDLVIGGPPCQSYSTVGKRQYDKRAEMYREYIRLLSFLRPKMFIFENVTGLLSMKNKSNRPVLEDIKNMFTNIAHDNKLGYTVIQKILNAKDFGVPQSRDRLFIVGIRQDLDCQYWRFPSKKFGTDDGMLPYLTVENAISDLPELEEGQSVNEYMLESQNDYQSLMRFNSNELIDHCIGNYGDKIKTVIAHVVQGEGREYINNLVATGALDKRYYLTSGYHNTYGRLWWDRPSTTITNSFATPSALRCIHPLQNRALSTREGARLQSFPDWIKFFGNKYEKNSQVGNAVPPLLAIELAKNVKCCFRKWEEIL
jgi:DNA (cytosine-5)-methyltransferase 1